MSYTLLLCSERSGSNLLTKIMDTHPEYCGPPPSHMIRTFAQNLGNYQPLESKANWKNLLTDVVDLLDCQLGKWKSKVTIQELERKGLEPSVPILLRYIFEKEAKVHGKTNLFIKENRAYRFLPFLLLAFPYSNFVYLHRDPRDVALSWKLSPNHPGSIIKATSVWLEDQEAFWMNYQILSSFGRAHRIGYEEILTEPEKSINQLCEFLSIEYKPEMLNYHEQEHTQENAQRLKDWQNLGKPLLEKNFNKYRNGLAEIEIRYIEAMIGGMMEKLGYERDFPNGVMTEELKQSAQELERGVQKEDTEMSALEQDVRARRLEVIHRIVNRKSGQTP